MRSLNLFSFQDDKDAFYVADLGDILKKHLRWLKALPRVTPVYAVKCNDSRAIVSTLAATGTGFDEQARLKYSWYRGLGCLQRGLSMQILVNKSHKSSMLPVTESR